MRFHYENNRHQFHKKCVSVATFAVPVVMSLSGCIWIILAILCLIWNDLPSEPFSSWNCIKVRKTRDFAQYDPSWFSPAQWWVYRLNSFKSFPSTQQGWQAWTKHAWVEKDRGTLSPVLFSIRLNCIGPAAVRRAPFQLSKEINHDDEHLLPIKRV